MSGKINLPHTCPKCKVTTATTPTELLDKFGYRASSSGTGATNQSWCKSCRSKAK